MLGVERFAVPHAGPAGERLISTAVCDAGPSAHSAEAARTAMQGASAVLLLITDSDDPAAADNRLATMYAACQQKVSPRVPDYKVIRSWPYICCSAHSCQHTLGPKRFTGFGQCF